MSSRFDRRQIVRSAALAGFGAAVILALGACRGSPLTRNEPSSQYDRYDAIRNQRAEPYVEDKFGRLIPNLRGRLSPKG